MKGATEQAKSADYKIVKLQSGIGFVKKLLNDRKSALASVMKLDKKVSPVVMNQKKEEEPFSVSSSVQMSLISNTSCSGLLCCEGFA